MALSEFNLSWDSIGYLILDVFLGVNFGTALSSCIHFFLKTQGQMSAVGTIVSASYGFICGAYMPISNFNDGLRNAISLLPGTYATSLLRYHSLNSIILKFNYPDDINELLLDNVDANMYFFGDKVSIATSYTILIVSTLVLIGIYVLMNILRKRNYR